MIRAERKATVVWKGSLARGDGRVTVGTGAFDEFGVSWPSRVEDPQGRTSPEELLAAAHASCMSMALAGELMRAELEPERLEVEAIFRLDDEGELSIKRADLRVRATVPGADRQAFDKVVQAAKEGCPVSKALRGNLEINVEAELVG
jgi:lipoyl-dependent peroxiredoxin